MTEVFNDGEKLGLAGLIFGIFLITYMVSQGRKDCDRMEYENLIKNQIGYSYSDEQGRHYFSATQQKEIEEKLKQYDESLRIAEENHYKQRESGIEKEISKTLDKWAGSKVPWAIR